MNDNELKSLLRSTETTALSARFAPDELAERVRRLDRQRRRRVRSVLVAAPLAAMCAAVAGWLLLPIPDRLPGHQRLASASVDLAEIERLKAEAEFHERVAREIRAGLERDRALADARRVLAQPDPLDEIREQIDVVAYRMIQRADALRSRMEPAEAIRVYRDVERMFPKTHSAELARIRLHELGASQGET